MTFSSLSLAACYFVRKPKLHSTLIPTLSLLSVIILQTFVKSFDDGSLHAATRQYDSAPSSFAFCAFVTTSSGVGN